MSSKSGATSTTKAAKPRETQQAPVRSSVVRPVVSSRKKDKPRPPKGPKTDSNRALVEPGSPPPARKREKRLTKALRKAPGPSKAELRQLMLNLEPTERRETELLYQLAIADPTDGPLVGVPLAMGGVPGKSVKIRSFSAAEFSGATAGGSTESFYFGVMQCSSDQEIDPSFGASEGANGFFGSSKFVFNRVPMVTNLQIVALDPAQVGFYNRNLGFAEWGDSTLFTVPVFENEQNYLSVSTVDPLISLQNGTICRVVGQELKIYPTNPLITSQGVGTLFQSSSTTATSLNNYTYDELYAQQGLARESKSLAGMASGDCFRAVRVPQLPRDLNFCQCDYSGRPSGALPAGDDPATNPLNGSGVGPFWAVFFATGLSTVAGAEATFRVEITTTYEFVNNGYSFSSENASVPLEMESVTPLNRVIAPHVIHEDDVPAQAAAHVLQAQAMVNGPKHALATATQAAGGDLHTPATNHIQDWGDKITSAVSGVNSGVEAASSAGEIIGDILGAIGMFL